MIYKICNRYCFRGLWSFSLRWAPWSVGSPGVMLAPVTASFFPPAPTIRKAAAPMLSLNEPSLQDLAVLFWMAAAASSPFSSRSRSFWIDHFLLCSSLEAASFSEVGGCGSTGAMKVCWGEAEAVSRNAPLLGSTTDAMIQSSGRVSSVGSSEMMYSVFPFRVVLRDLGWYICHVAASVLR